MGEQVLTTPGDVSPEKLDEVKAEAEEEKPPESWESQMERAWQMIGEADPDVLESVISRINGSPENLPVYIMRKENISEGGLYLTLLMGYLSGAGERPAVGLRLLTKALDALDIDVGVSAIYDGDAGDVKVSD